MRRVLVHQAPGRSQHQPRRYGLRDLEGSIIGSMRRGVLAFSSVRYKWQYLVEGFFSKLKPFRAVATRCEKHAENYLAPVDLASVRISLQSMSR